MATKGNFEQLEQTLIGLPQAVVEALQWVAILDLEQLELGTHPMTGTDHYLNVMTYQSAPDNERVWESHLRFIDIHMVLEGSEKLAVTRAPFGEVIKPYTIDEDYLLWRSDVYGHDNEEHQVYQLHPGDWLLCDQKDIHKTGIFIDQPATVKKAVLKVALPVSNRYMAIDVGGTAIKYGTIEKSATSDDLTLTGQAEVPTEAAASGEALMERLIRLAMDHWPICGVGISTAGQVDRHKGVVSFATDTLPGWTGMEIVNRMNSALGVPAAAINDVEAVALGEWTLGGARGHHKTLCLTFGTGIGGAILWHGDIESGANGSAGEFGHMITHGGGLPCTCGGRGCYEQYAATRALMASVKNQNLNEHFPDGHHLIKAYCQGDQTAVSLVQPWLEEITIGLVSLVHIFNPSCILLGGGIMAQEVLVDNLRTLLDQQIMPTYREVALISAKLGNTAGLYGAVIHLLRRIENA